METDEIMSLFNEYGDAIYNFCMYLAKNRHDGEDLFQQTFMRAIEISYRIDKHNNPKSYLMSIAVNVWRNTFQKRNRRARISQTMEMGSGEAENLKDHGADVEASVISKIMSDALLEIVNRLDDKYRIPVIMAYMEDMKISEIAAAISKPEGTVKRRIHEAKKKMRKEMEAMGYEQR